MNTAAEDMWDINIRDVGQRRCQNGLEDGNGMGKYRQETATNLRAYRHSNNLGLGATEDLHGDLRCIWRLCVSHIVI